MKKTFLVLLFLVVMFNTVEVDAKGLINIDNNLEFKEGQWLNGYPTEWNYQAEVTYLKNKKNENLASLLATIPSLGHAYAGDWETGRKFLYAEVIELLIMALSFNEEDNFDYKNLSKREVVAVLSCFSFVGTKTWEILDAYRIAEITNAKLKHNISLKVRNGQLKVTKGYSF